MNDLNVIDAEFTEVTEEQFDYSELDTDTAKQLQAIAEEDMKATAVFWVKRAERLTRANELLANNRNGTFSRWVEQEIGISRQWANKLIDSYAEYKGFIGNLVSNKTADQLPQSFYRKLAEHDPKAEQIKEEVLAGKIKNSKEYKAALAKIKELEEKTKSAGKEQEKTIENLRSVLNDTRKELEETKEKAKAADPEHLAKLQSDKEKAEKAKQKANRDYEMLQDRFEDLNKKAGNLMRERDEKAKLAEEIAQDLKQSQELNNKLLAERGQTDSETEIVAVLATAARQITDENMGACVQHILSLTDGQTILARFRAILEVAT